MLRTLPYTALRTLESVVRLRGFSRAADELNVTQSAVSQHVKHLEGWLGRQLVIRQSPQIVPTEDGELLARTIRDGFFAIEALCDELRNAKQTRAAGLLVAAPPGFAFVWLLPRLLHFDEVNPDMPVSLSTDPKSQDPDASAADVIISYGTGNFPSLHAEKLMSERMSPVCSPKLAQALKTPADLANHVILQDTFDGHEHRSMWDFWAKEVQVTLPHFKQARKYGQANMVIQAAINGQGVAMGRGPLVQDAIAAGTLVYPFAQAAQSQLSYWFVCEHDALRSKSVQAFRSWVHAQARNANDGISIG
jgi:LysR family glycine cleavage system transcriptional activator